MKQFLIPSKTFLLGEYLALTHGVGLVAVHSPFFRMQLTNENPTEFSPLSAAGKYRKNTSFQFTDPHKGLGGFGCSGAECIATRLSETLEKIDPWETLGLFADQGSGLDILSQSYGINQETDQILCIDKKAKTIEVMPRLGIFVTIFHTQKKVPTHEHLKTLEQNAFSHLYPIFSAAIENWKTKNSAGFLAKSDQYQKALNSFGLLAKHSKLALDDLSSLNVLGAKACGAMGSDTIIVYTKTQNQNLKEWQEKHSLLEIHRFPV
ncbi:MAG: hypothetical protein M9962_12055 [Oligoflexia bacterium]|nr:hypothetical protein [Oligoflexia bacterium]